MNYPELKTPCIYVAKCQDCSEWHPLGRGHALFTWKSYDPLAVSVTALSFMGQPMIPAQGGDSTFWTNRDTIHTAVRSGRSFGCPVVGEGNVTFKVLAGNVTQMTIRWNPGYTIIVDRDAVSKWIDGTYTIVGSQYENEVLDVDGAIRKILEETK